ncbi:EYxxD motif small membrane protein [Alteribacillus sp. JSM 102045]
MLVPFLRDFALDTLFVYAMIIGTIAVLIIGFTRYRRER